MPDSRSPDRRVRRTRSLLHRALATLIHEKPYDAIVVKEILARADVGRSTVYAHFRDKDELLASGMRDMLRADGNVAPRGVSQAAWVLRFSLPLLEHNGGHAAGPVADAGHGDHTPGQGAVHEHLRRALVESVGEDLRHAAAHTRHLPAVPISLLAEHVAATFVLVLDRWIAGGMAYPAREANGHFLALVRPALADALGERGLQVR